MFFLGLQVRLRIGCRQQIRQLRCRDLRRMLDVLVDVIELGAEVACLPRPLLELSWPFEVSRRVIFIFVSQNLELARPHDICLLILNEALNNLLIVNFVHLSFQHFG